MPAASAQQHAARQPGDAGRALASLERLVLEQREALVALDAGRIEQVGAALGDALGRLAPALREAGNEIPRGRLEALKAGLDLNAAMLARTGAVVHQRLHAMLGQPQGGYTAQGGPAVAAGGGLRASA